MLSRQVFVASGREQHARFRSRLDAARTGMTGCAERCKADFYEVVFNGVKEGSASTLKLKTVIEATMGRFGLTKRRTAIDQQKLLCFCVSRAVGCAKSVVAARRCARAVKVDCYLSWIGSAVTKDWWTKRLQQSPESC